MNRFLFKIITEDGFHIECRYDRAMKYYEKYGIKMYAYTKNLFPTTILMHWKRPSVSSFLSCAWANVCL